MTHWTTPSVCLVIGMPLGAMSLASVDGGKPLAAHHVLDQRSWRQVRGIHAPTVGTFFAPHAVCGSVVALVIQEGPFRYGPDEDLVQQPVRQASVMRAVTVLLDPPHPFPTTVRPHSKLGPQDLYWRRTWTWHVTISSALPAMPATTRPSRILFAVRMALRTVRSKGLSDSHVLTPSAAV